jgi:ABC-2 type transport system permease protein
MTALLEAPTDSSGRGTAAFTGTAALVRFALRRDRIRIVAWLGGLVGATVMTATSFATLYPTEADRQTIAEATASPTMIAMTGVNHGAADYTHGAMLGHQMLWFTMILVALMSVLLVVRHTRTEEATGRAELVRSSVVGRHATTSAGITVVAVANVGLAVLLALSLGAIGIDGVTWEGAWLYGAAHAAVGLVFAGIAAITVQITEHPRGASGLGIGAIGLAYVLRAIGDMGDGTLSWLSPLGWAQATQVFVSDRWWPLLVATAAIPLLAGVAFWLSTKRDVGSGLRQPRPGTATASEILARPLGFALRLHRASLVAWVAAIFLLGVSYGSVLGDAEQMLLDIEALAEFVPEIAGVNVTESFAAMMLTIMAIISAVYVVLATIRMRSEETAGRAEPLLATGLSRTRWAGSHLTVAMVGGTLVLLAGGLGIGVAGASSTGDASLLPRLVVASILYAPALWVTIGVTVVLFGVLPRAISLAWVVVGYSFVVVYLGGMLQFPDWMNNLSPFGHVPQLPAEEFALAPIVVLTGIAAALVIAGLTAFDRRGLQSTT